MNRLSNTFLRLAVIFALVGMGIGYAMGASGDHALATAHAHINLLGWVSMFLYGLFYRSVPTAATGFLPRAHFWVAVIGFVAMTTSLAVKLLAVPTLAGAAEIGLIIGSTLVVLGMILLAVIIFRATGDRATG